MPPPEVARARLLRSQIDQMGGANNAGDTGIGEPVLDESHEEGDNDVELDDQEPDPEHEQEPHLTGTTLGPPPLSSATSEVSRRGADIMAMVEQVLQQQQQRRRELQREEKRRRRELEREEKRRRREQEQHNKREIEAVIQNALLQSSNHNNNTNNGGGHNNNNGQN